MIALVVGENREITLGGLAHDIVPAKLVGAIRQSAMVGHLLRLSAKPTGCAALSRQLFQQWLSGITLAAVPASGGLMSQCAYGLISV